MKQLQTLTAVGCIVMLATAFFSCTNQPSPVGSTLIPSQNKLVFRSLNSVNPTDSLSLTYREFLQHISGGTSLTNAFIGSYKSYQSRELIKIIPFFQDSSFLDSAEQNGSLLSTYLQLTLTGYRFGDTSASMQFHCTANQILTPYDIGATWDSLGSLANFSPTAVGSFNGTINKEDSLLKIALDTAMVMRLMRYGNGDSVLAYFQGLAILPQAGTSGIASFNISAGVTVHAVVIQNGGTIDTPIASGVQMLYIASSNEPNTSNEMTFQSGIQQRLHLYVNAPTIPKLSTVNAAWLQLTLDTVNSLFGQNHVRDSLGLSSRDTIFIGLAASDDSVIITNSLLTPLMGTRVPNTNTYLFPFLSPFVQSWTHGMTNFGMVPLQGFGSVIGTGDQFTTLDKFVFYSPTDPDTTRRAKLQVLYSTQAPQ